MKRHEMRQQVAAVVLAALLMWFPSAAAAQEKSAPQTGAKSEVAAKTSKGATTEKDESRGPQEGIKVHGHWTITVRNADGSVAAHHEFENALAPEGAATLTDALTLTPLPPPSWIIVLTLNTTGQPAVTDYFAKTTVQSVNGTVVLTASPKLSFASFPTTALQVIGVKTLLQLAHGLQPFTSRDLTKPVPPSTTPPPSINVQDGQTVDVTVTISFS